MCVALPGKVVSINGNKASVSFRGTEMNIDVSMIDVSVGDYVLVHAGCAIEVMAEDQAREILEIFEELEEIS